MLVDEQKLRWFGIDMRPVARRRVAVVATYVGFLFVVWVHPPRTYQALQVLFWAGVTSGIWPLIEEAMGVWKRRAIAGVALAYAAWSVFWQRPLHLYRDPAGLDGAALALAVLALMSVVGVGRLVRIGHPGWMVNAIRKGSKLSWRGQRRLARQGFLYGREGFAWNEFGLRFGNLTEVQKLVVERMRKANPQGKWMTGMERKLVDDECMRQEDNRIRASVQRTMSWVLGCSALVWAWAAVNEWKVTAETAALWAWTMFGLAATLRQAIVLWTEDDPHGASDELEIVEPQEA